MPSPSELQTSVTTRRQALGVAQGALAERIGVSRQALSAIEAGRATPSTAIALRLARALHCSVEDLFALPTPSVGALRLPELTGARVALGLVAERWVAHQLDAASTDAADALVLADGSIRAFFPQERLQQRVLISGCAPVLGALVGHLERLGGVGARWIHASSRASLRALAEGRVHLAGLHLAAHDRPEQHDQLVRELLPGVPVVIIGLVRWREGLALAPGNPKALGVIGDLQRAELRIGQRPEGSGAAHVLASALSAAGLSPHTTGPAVATHSDAAGAVLYGAADAAVVIEPVAAAFGLPFLPLSEERFELVLRAEHLQQAGVQQLLAHLNTAHFAHEVQSMGAYDVSPLGKLRRVDAA